MDKGPWEGGFPGWVSCIVKAAIYTNACTLAGHGHFSTVNQGLACGVRFRRGRTPKSQREMMGEGFSQASQASHSLHLLLGSADVDVDVDQLRAYPDQIHGQSTRGPGAAASALPTCSSDLSFTVQSSQTGPSHIPEQPQITRPPMTTAGEQVIAPNGWCCL